MAETRQRDWQLQAKDPRRDLLYALTRRLPLFADRLRCGMVVVGHPFVLAEQQAEAEVARAGVAVSWPARFGPTGPFRAIHGALPTRGSGMRHLRVHGGFVDLDPQHPDVFAFTHTLDDDRLLVAINFGSAPQQFDLPADTSVA